MAGNNPAPGAANNFTKSINPEQIFKGDEVVARIKPGKEDKGPPSLRGQASSHGESYGVTLKMSTGRTFPAMAEIYNFFVKEDHPGINENAALPLADFKKAMTDVDKQLGNQGGKRHRRKTKKGKSRSRRRVTRKY